MLGFLNINKPSGMSSAQVVAKLKKKFHIAKIGHMGTLDPMASGVLPIAIGKATRLFDYFLQKEKTYIAQFEFGYLTNTLDAEGEIVSTTFSIPTKEQIEKVLPSLQGETNQMPPKFSAKNVGGVRAYDLARQGKEVQLQPKTVYIKEIKLLRPITPTIYEFSITCSSGTYIRSIARDMGETLGSLATMVALQRVKSGYFTIDNAYSVEEIEDISKVLISPTKIFANYPIIYLNDQQFTHLQNGKSVHTVEDNGLYWLVYQSKLLGLGECTNNSVKINVYLWEDNHG